MKISQPTEKHYDVKSFQHRYIQAVTGDDAMQTLKENLVNVEKFFKNIPENKLHYRYFEGKWTPLEILGHMVDAERVLCYRALCVARNDKQNLPPFEEDDYVKATNFDKKSLRSLLLLYKAQRKSTLLLFKSFSKREMERVGQANNLPTSARSLAWVIAGHELHHLNLLKERYL